MKASELFWHASPAEIKNGYIDTGQEYVCLLCGEKIEKGLVYPGDGIFYEAQRYIQVHIEENHGQVFDYLIQLDKRVTGLTEHQKKLLQLFYQGKSDLEVQKEMGIGSVSTIRNHRFVLKEKERQAKVFLALMELLREKNRPSPVQAPSQKTGVVDNTRAENDKIIKKYFPEGREGKLIQLPMKDKFRRVVLKEISNRFEQNVVYSEKEVNEILQTVHEDYVTLRRLLIEYGFLDRLPDGSQYWLKGESTGRVEENMDRKKELKQQYKEMKVEGGVYQIRNTVNQKVFIDSLPNLKSMNGRLMMLRAGSHKNRELQEDFNKYGEEAFVFEVLEVLEEKEEGFFDRAEELKKLEAKWIAQVQPFGERGYNRPKR